MKKKEQIGRKSIINIIDLNKKVQKNISEETIKNIIKIYKKQVNTNNYIFYKKVTTNYIVTVDNIFANDIIIIEKVDSLEKDSIGLLLFENHIFIKKILSDYKEISDNDPIILGKVIWVYRLFF